MAETNTIYVLPGDVLILPSEGDGYVDSGCMTELEEHLEVKHIVLTEGIAAPWILRKATPITQAELGTQLRRQLHPSAGINHTGYEGFHAHDGWYFQRQPDGSVKISAAVSRCGEEITLGADTWASIVASMSAEGETSVRWQQAREFHSPQANTQADA